MCLKLTLFEMQALARKRGGWCLSSAYTGALKKIRWRCANGHEWEATPSSIKNCGTWCAKCLTLSLRDSIEEMQALAEKHQGECLSSTYAGAHSKLKWRCAKGHEWDARPSSIKAMGTWCPKCSDRGRPGTDAGIIEKIKV